MKWHIRRPAVRLPELECFPADFLFFDICKIFAPTWLLNIYTNFDASDFADDSVQYGHRAPRNSKVPRGWVPS